MKMGVQSKLFKDIYGIFIEKKTEFILLELSNINLDNCCNMMVLYIILKIKQFNY